MLAPLSLQPSTPNLGLYRGEFGLGILIRASSMVAWNPKRKLQLDTSCAFQPDEDCLQSQLDYGVTSMLGTDSEYSILTLVPR